MVLVGTASAEHKWKAGDTLTAKAWNAAAKRLGCPEVAGKREREVLLLADTRALIVCAARKASRDDGDAELVGLLFDQAMKEPGATR
jgi:hypothetical protein